MEGGRGADVAARVWPQAWPGVCRRLGAGERWGVTYLGVARVGYAATGDVIGGSKVALGEP